MRMRAWVNTLDKELYDESDAEIPVVTNSDLGMWTQIWVSTQKEKLTGY